MWVRVHVRVLESYILLNLQETSHDVPNHNILHSSGYLCRKHYQLWNFFLIIIQIVWCYGKQKIDPPTHAIAGTEGRGTWHLLGIFISISKISLSNTKFPIFITHCCQLLSGPCGNLTTMANPRRNHPSSSHVVGCLHPSPNQPSTHCDYSHNSQYPCKIKTLELVIYQLDLHQ